MDNKSNGDVVSVSVVIAGEIVTLSGPESEEYYQRIASYLDKKLSEMQKARNWFAANSFMRTLQISVNIAEDYYCQKTRADANSIELKNHKTELDKLQEENILIKDKIRELQAELENAWNELSEYTETFPIPPTTDPATKKDPSRNTKYKR